jgi:hypothetical protein
MESKGGRGWIQALGVTGHMRPFTELDWDGFAGAEGEGAVPPHIFYSGSHGPTLVASAGMIELVLEDCSYTLPVPTLALGIFLCEAMIRARCLDAISWSLLGARRIN